MADCDALKAAAKSQFDSNEYEESGDEIGATEFTNSNTATLTNVRGKIRGNLTNYTSTNTTGVHSLVVLAEQATDGSSNVPSPIVVTDPPTYQTFTTLFSLGQTVTIPSSGSINDQSIDFTIPTCASDTTMGWSMTDQQFILNINRTKTAVVRRS